MMKFTWMLLTAIVIVSLVGSNLPAEVTDDTPMKKDHISVIAPEYSVSMKILRNSSGHPIGMEGVSPLMIDWLSRRYKFEYSIVFPPASMTTVDNFGPKNPGFISYVLRGECELIMTAIIPAAMIQRLPVLELVHPWFYTNIAFIVPMPEEIQNNVDAIIKPFQFWVWVGILLALISVIVTIICFNKIIKRKDRSTRNKHQEVNQLLDPVGVSRVTKEIFMYVIGTLMSQGGYISSKTTFIRLVIGAWCLLTLVLVNVYNGVLISYVTSTHQTPPLINSIQDVVSNSYIRLTVTKGQGPDNVFSTAKLGLYKALGDKLRTYPLSRCNATQQCLDMVKSLPAQHVYLDFETALKEAIREDYRKNRQCKLTIGAADDSVKGGVWALAKKSPHLEKFNQGTLELHEYGLISYWEKQFEPNTKPCYSENPIRIESNKKPLHRLSLTNLMGAFVLLAVGFLISFFVFLVEKIISVWKTNRVVVVC